MSRSIDTNIEYEELAELRAKAKASIERAKETVRIVRELRRIQEHELETWHSGFHKWIDEKRSGLQSSREFLQVDQMGS